MKKNWMRTMQSDERKAPSDYKHLIGQLERKSDKKKVMNIIKQERKHLVILHKIAKKKGYLED